MMFTQTGVADMGSRKQSPCRSMLVFVVLGLGLSLVASFFAGCGERGPERVPVSGTVTYNGKPLPEGTVRFVPVQTSPVPSSGATITEGKYTANASGGVPIGTYHIQIEAYRHVKGGPGSLHENVLQQYVPRKYNTNTQLQITIEPGSRAITKNFELAD